MSDPNRLKHSPVLAALDFDSSLANTLELAAILAEKTHSTLVLLHAVREWSQIAAASMEQSMAIPVGDVIAANVQAEIEDARKQLDDLAAPLRHSLVVDVRVVTGVPAQLIGAEAVILQAQAIVMGSPVDSWRRKEHRLSTLLSVMHDAPCPVIVVSSEGLPKKLPSIAIADDLTAWSRPAVAAGFYLAEAFDIPHVYHIHVNPLQRERFAQALRKYAARQGTIVRPDAAADFFKDLEHDLSKQLRERAEDQSVWYPEREGKYTASVLHGPVLEAIETAISKDQGWNAGMIVFGQHRNFHRHPFRAGNIPFGEMARLGKTAVVVPPDAA